MKDQLKSILKTGYYGHAYSADIHVSTMVPKNTMAVILEQDENRKHRIADYMKMWLNNE